MQTRYKLIKDMAILLNKSKYVKPISIRNLKLNIPPRGQGIKSNVKNFKISKSQVDLGDFNELTF